MRIYDYENYEVAYYMGLSTPNQSWLDSMIRRDVYQHSYPEILSRITENKFRREFTRRKINLDECSDWVYENGIIRHVENKFFDETEEENLYNKFVRG